MRTSASSESKRNAASALQSSVLPTPVGPEEQERTVGLVGIGQSRTRTADRVGDEAHRFVLADDALVELVFHHAAASSRSPCIIFDTGMPVARDTTSAISSTPTCVRSSLLAAPSCGRGLGFLQLLLELRDLPVLQLAHLLPVALALEFLELELGLLELFLDVRRALHACLLGLPHFLEVGVLLLEALDLARRSSARRFFDASSFSFFTASRSIFSWMRRRSRRSITSGLESISILMREAASSIRSIALSGRKRSVM